MAEYTIRIDEIVKYLNKGSVGRSWNEKILAAAKHIFDFDYPFYGQTPQEQISNKTSFQLMFLKHNMMREIGYETYEIWQLMLDERLNLIMPKYQQLYLSTLFELDFDSPYHLITTHEQDTSDTGRIDNIVSASSTNNLVRNGDNQYTGNSNVKRTDNLQESDNGTENITHDSKTVNSDFPNASYENGNYASNGSELEENQKTTHNSTKENTGTVDTSESLKYNEASNQTENAKFDENRSDQKTIDNKGTLDFIRDVSGHTSNTEILEAVEKWRKLIININDMIIKELADLFIMVYD